MPKTYILQDLPETERPRERLKTLGPENLSLAELLAIIIQKGTPGRSVLTTAANLLSAFGNLQNIKKAPLAQLQKVPGIGFATACKLKAALALSEKLPQSSQKTLNSQSPIKISSPKDVYSLLKPQIAQKKKEHFKLLSLNIRDSLLSIDSISVGSLDISIAHPREVYLPAIQNSAKKIILAHNHPSEDPAPSKPDLEVTKRIALAGEIIDIRLADHIIIAPSSYFSFRENNLL